MGLDGGGSENGDSSVGLFAGSEGLARAVSLLDVECRQVDAEADSSAEGDALVGLGRGHGVGAAVDAGGAAAAAGGRRRARTGGQRVAHGHRRVGRKVDFAQISQVDRLRLTERVGVQATVGLALRQRSRTCNTQQAVSSGSRISLR